MHKRIIKKIINRAWQVGETKASIFLFLPSKLLFSDLIICR
jgi:hypothetical protein